MPTIAVITIDVINSTKLSSALLESVMERLDEECQSLQKEDAVAYFEIFRGDSLQLIVPEPHDALRISFQLKCAVNSNFQEKETKTTRGNKIETDIRFAIGIGESEMTVFNKMTNEQPFVRSGRMLDEILRIGNNSGIITGNPFADKELKTELYLYEGISRKWTLPVAEVVYHKLIGKTEQVIADELNISQSAINQRSHSAYWSGLDLLLKRYEEICKEQIEL